MSNSNDDRFPPPGTGESIGRRGEDIAKAEKESGRVDLGRDENGRPTGGPSERLFTGIDPKESGEA